jgi:hypothetical protein
VQVRQNKKANPSVRKDLVAIPLKKCLFLCGCTTHDTDPVNPDRLAIRWAGDCADSDPTGEGLNCYYCERAFALEAHKVPDRDRQLYIRDLSRDADNLAAHTIVRKKVVARAARKHKGEGRSSRSVRVKVRKQRFSESALVRPDDDFWKMKRYKKRFGSVNLPKNRALGHRKSVVDNVSGVIVPGDDGIGPWKLRHTQGVRLEKDEEEAISSDDASAAEDVYNDMVESSRAGYRKVAQGAMADILAGFVMDDEGREEEAKRQTASAKKRKQRKKGVVTGESRKRRANNNMFDEAKSDDSDDGDCDSASDGPPRKKPKLVVANKPGQKGAARKTSTVVAASCAASSAEKAAGDGAEDSGNDPESQQKKSGPGRPESDARSHAVALWSQFEVATEASLFFNTNAAVQRRMLARWIQKAAQKALSSSGRDLEEFDLAKKKLQIMDQGIALQRKWAQRTDMARAQSEFDSAWQLLQGFADASPQVLFRCKFLWHLYLQIQAVVACIYIYICMCINMCI